MSRDRGVRAFTVMRSRLSPGPFARNAPDARVTDPMGCPGCAASVTPQPVAYGLPGSELMDAAKRGQVFLAGCVVSPHFPSHRCPACGIGLGRISDRWAPRG